MAKAQRKLTSEERKICEELAGAALPALGIKLSSAKPIEFAVAKAMDFAREAGQEFAGVSNAWKTILFVGSD